MNGVSPESGDAVVSFRVDTGTQGTLSLTSRENLRKTVLLHLPCGGIPLLLLSLFLFWKTCRWQCKEKRSEDTRDKDVESFCCVKKKKKHLLKKKFKDMHQRHFHVVLFCCLFDASQLIMLLVGSYSLSASSNSKYNYPDCAPRLSHLIAMARGASSPQFCPTHISLCANVLCTPWSCTVIWLTQKSSQQWPMLSSTVPALWTVYSCSDETKHIYQEHWY